MEKEAERGAKRGVRLSLIILVSVVTLLLIIVATHSIGNSFLSGDTIITSSTTWNLENGDAQIMTSSGWRPLSNGTELSTGNVIRTLDDSQGSILIRNAVVRMDSNTVIGLSQLDEDNISLYQNSGRSWTRFLPGITTSLYSLRTPDAVATAEGTAFSVRVDRRRGTEVQVGEGKVSVDAGRGKALVEQQKQIVVSRMKKYSNLNAQKTSIRDDGWVDSNLKKDSEYMGEMPANPATANEAGAAANKIKGHSGRGPESAPGQQEQQDNKEDNGNQGNQGNNGNGNENQENQGNQDNGNGNQNQDNSNNGNGNQDNGNGNQNQDNSNNGNGNQDNGNGNSKKDRGSITGAAVEPVEKSPSLLDQIIKFFKSIF